MVIFFLLGLIIGSFLNVVAIRLEVAESLLGRSHCPHCQARVRWHDNIPLLSFVLLGARCRDCGEKISAQYFWVELLTGIIFALVGSLFFDPLVLATWTETTFYLVMSSILIVIFVYDFRSMEIPMTVVWSGVIMALLYSIYADWTGFGAGHKFLEFRTFAGVVGGAVAFLFFFLISYFSKERWMGMGDAYVGLLIGLVVGWPLILLALTSSFTIGAVFGLMLIALGKKTMQSQVPFAPFLVLGTFCVIILDKIYPQLIDLFWPFVS